MKKSKKEPAEYAVYRGDQFIDLGTLTYLAEKYSRKEQSLKFLATPSAHKRAKETAKWREIYSNLDKYLGN